MKSEGSEQGLAVAVSIVKITSVHSVEIVVWVAEETGHRYYRIPS